MKQLGRSDTWSRWPRARALDVAKSRRVLEYFVLVALFVAASVLLAATPASGQLEVLGGATYNTYSLDWGTDQGLTFNSGWGAYGGFQYWLNPLLAIGGQVDTFTGSGRERWVLGDGSTQLVVGTEGQGVGYLTTLAAPIAAHGIMDVTPFVAVGVYRVTAGMTLRKQGSDEASGNVTAKGRLTTPSHVGGKFGVMVGKEIAPGLVLAGQLAYRLVPAFKDMRVEVLGFEQDWVADPGIDVTGLSAGVIVSYHF